MIKIWTLYISILFPTLFLSQKQSGEFISKKDSLKPGTTTSISFTIENTTAENKSYTIDIETPNRFLIPIVSENEISVPANDIRVYVLALKISTEIPQGNYVISLNAKEVKTGTILKRESEIIINRTKKISLSLLQSPEFIKAGETITAGFVLKNEGNRSENLILESRNAVIQQGSRIRLSPGESKIIDMSKKTDINLGKNEFQNLSLSVYSSENPGESQTAYTSVKIISVKPLDDDIYHRLPVSASLSFIGMKNRGEYNNGFQGEIYGKGSVDKDNRGFLEFRAVSENPVEFNSFTQYEEYFINYKNKNLYIHLGDKTYSSSFLTEFARYGRGAELKYEFKKISIGGFYNHPRFFRDIKDEFNVYTQLKIGKESEITAGYLYKIPRTEETGFGFNNTRLDSDAHLPFLTGKFKLNNHLNILSEVAYSKTVLTEGNAYMIQATANYEKVNGNVMYTKASPKFAGYFTNTNTFNGNLQYRISDRLNIFGNYTQDARNFQRDTLFLAAPYRKFLQYGINYRYTKGGNVIFYNGFQKYQDRLEPRQFDYFERFFKLSVDQQIGAFHLNLEGQFGKTDNYLTGFEGHSNFYTANLSFEKFKTSFNLYGSYALTSRYQMQNQKQIYYGARILSRFSLKSQLSIFYQNNYLPEEYFNDRNLFEVLYHQQLLLGHELDLSGRYTLQRGELGNKDFIFSLRYTLRMNVPVQKTAEYTTLIGSIQNLGVRKTSGVRLMLGNHLTVTDKHGNFVFKNIFPGDYFLEIDRSTTDLNDISDVQLPAEISLSAKENVFNFGLTVSSQILGEIIFNENKKEISTAEISESKKKKKNHIIIEISDGRQTYRKIGFLGEKFDFTYLRPGDWNLKIYRNGLDKRYRISMDHYSFTLTPSETKNVVINVVRQQTEVKYQQETVKVGYQETGKRK